MKMGWGNLYQISVRLLRLLGDCEGEALGKAFTELGAKSEILAVRPQKEAPSLNEL